jgi:SAM-dependent methyltransferase
MDYFIELYGSLPRAGPGDSASTRRAFEMMRGLPSAPRILDLGCGPGVQTVDLLRLCAGKVTALDLLPQMIARVEEVAEQAGAADRLETIQADMNEVRLPAASFDVVWSEGAIYNMGFEDGLAKVKGWVKPGGRVAVTEPVWLVDDPPREARAFWQAYPAIDSLAGKRAVVSRLGYEPVGDFVLPASSWNDRYYDPLERRAAELAPGWRGIREAEAVLAEAREEIAVFREHGDSYSYAFFVMRRPAE